MTGPLAAYKRSRGTGDYIEQTQLAVRAGLRLEAFESSALTDQVNC